MFLDLRVNTYEWVIPQVEEQKYGRKNIQLPCLGVVPIYNLIICFTSFVLLCVFIT